MQPKDLFSKDGYIAAIWQEAQIGHRAWAEIIIVVDALYEMHSGPYKGRNLVLAEYLFTLKLVAEWYEQQEYLARQELYRFQALKALMLH